MGMRIFSGTWEFAAGGGGRWSIGRRDAMSDEQLLAEGLSGMLVASWKQINVG